MVQRNGGRARLHRWAPSDCVRRPARVLPRAAQEEPHYRDIHGQRHARVRRLPLQGGGCRAAVCQLGSPPDAGVVANARELGALRRRRDHGPRRERDHRGVARRGQALPEGTATCVISTAAKGTNITILMRFDDVRCLFMLPNICCSPPCDEICWRYLYLADLI